MTLLTVPEAAKRLGVNRATVWRMVQRGELVPTVRVNKQALFSEEYISIVAHKTRKQAA